MSQAWTPNFDPLCGDVVTAPVWARLFGIPVYFYNRQILLGILMKGRARFARICIEVNLKKPLKGSVLVNGVMLNICSGCGIYVLLVAKCGRKEVRCQTRQTWIIRRIKP